MRVAVIGCGIVGSSVAWHLTKRGANVTVIDVGGPGTGVTNWSFAWVNASNKTRTREYFDLNVAGLQAHYELAATLGHADWWHPTGHLRWCDDEASAADLRSTVNLLHSWGYDASIWDARRVRRLLEPQVRFPSDDADVAFFRDEGWVSGRRLAARLVDEILSDGGEAHFGTAVKDILTTGSRISGLVLSNEQRLEADAVVNAAGPAGGEIATLVGRTLPMRDEPGLVGRVRLNGVSAVRRAMHSPHVELRPDGAAQVMLHSRQIDSLIGDGAEISGLSKELHGLAIQVVPSLELSDLIDARVAWRPIPLDEFPSVGGVDEPAGYYEAVTHSGITLGVILGRLLAQEILDGTVNGLVTSYRPARFH